MVEQIKLGMKPFECMVECTFEFIHAADGAFFPEMKVKPGKATQDSTGQGQWFNDLELSFVHGIDRVIVGDDGIPPVLVRREPFAAKACQVNGNGVRADGAEVNHSIEFVADEEEVIGASITQDGLERKQPVFELLQSLDCRGNK